MRSLAGPAARNVMSRKIVMPARSSGTTSSASNRCRVENHNGKAAEIRSVERKQSSDSVILHRRHEADVMRSEAGHNVSLNQVLPKPTQLFAVGKQRETASKEAQPVSGLRRGH